MGCFGEIKVEIKKKKKTKEVGKNLRKMKIWKVKYLNILSRNVR